MKSNAPKITFGLITLNGQPFLLRNLRALYPYAHQIIVVEGATRSASGLARSDGHSKDGSFEMLQTFQAEEDPDEKLVVVSAADEAYADGYWPEKDEMSQAYAKRATGDWLWQVDSDEFYFDEDMEFICQMLAEDESISAVSFPYVEFFGGFDYQISGQWQNYEHPLFHRLFRWRPGYRYAEHRPPTVVDEKGRDLRSLNWLSAPMNVGRKIFLHHYAYVLPKQAEQKAGYYANVDWTDAFSDNNRWLRDQYFGLKRPLLLGQRRRREFHWLERFQGKHPQQIDSLLADLEEGKENVELRPTEDIDRLLSSPFYRLAGLNAKLWLSIYWPIRSIWKMRLRPLLFGKSH
jgi:hypothetical protein